MIEYREEPGSDIVEFVIDGRISKADFDQIAAKLEAAIARHGKVRLLEEVRSIGSIEPSVFWDDMKFGLRHMNDFSRAAVVADQTWIRWITKAVTPFLRCEVRIFGRAQIDQARQWLHEGAGETGAAASA